MLPSMKAPTGFGEACPQDMATAVGAMTHAAKDSFPPTAESTKGAASAMGMRTGAVQLPAYVHKVADTSWAAVLAQPARLATTLPAATKRSPGSARVGRPKTILKVGAVSNTPAYLQKAVVSEAWPDEAEAVTCHLDFDQGNDRPPKRVRFVTPRGIADDPQMRAAQASMAAKAAAKEAARATPRSRPSVTPERVFEDVALRDILQDISHDLAAYTTGKPRGDWDAIEEKEEAQAWMHAAALANVLPEHTIVQLLGGPEASAQVPDRETRASILVSALKSRGGPSGAGSRLAMTAWRTLVHLTPAGAPTLPASAAFVASCKRSVDAAAKAKCANRKQGGATVVQRFEAGLYALASTEKGLGMDITIAGIVVVNAVEKFVPAHRDQAATAPIALMVAACRTARMELPPYVARRNEVPSAALTALRLRRLRATLQRHTARVVVLAWTFGLRFKHMQRFTPLIDEFDPDNVIAGRASLAKDGEPLDVFAPAMDLLGKFSWFNDFVDEFAALGNHCFPAFTAEWGEAGNPAFALSLSGGFATDENSRKGLHHSMGITKEMLKGFGVSWHSLHGSLADDGSVLATVPIEGYVLTHDMLRCLGWWRRNARQNIDVAAAASSCGVIAARSRDFSVSVGLPSMLSEMLIRYSSGAGRNGVRARAIAARTAVIAILAKGVALIGVDRLATGSAGIRQIKDKVRETLTPQRQP